MLLQLSANIEQMPTMKNGKMVSLQQLIDYFLITQLATGSRNFNFLNYL